MRGIHYVTKKAKRCDEAPLIGRINLNVDRETEHECNCPRLKKQPWSNDNLYSVIVIRNRLPRNEK